MGFTVSFLFIDDNGIDGIDEDEDDDDDDDDD